MFFYHGQTRKNVFLVVTGRIHITLANQKEDKCFSILLLK